MILSCILLRKMDSVVVSGFGAAIGLGRPGLIWALAKDAKAETNNIPTGTTTRATGRNIKNPPHLGCAGKGLEIHGSPLTGLCTRCDLLGTVHVARQHAPTSTH